MMVNFLKLILCHIAVYALLMIYKMMKMYIVH